MPCQLRLLALLIVLLASLTVGCSANSADDAPAFGFGPSPESSTPNVAATQAQPDTETPTPQVRVLVTTSFGQAVLLDELIDLDSKTSALEALERVADVQTKYGGGFVHDVNNTRSTLATNGDCDWFVYINGIQTRTGAAGYTLHPGDVETWDLHSWNFWQSIPSVVGSFPEPFLHGYGGKVRPTVVAYSESFQAEAEALARLLSELGVHEVATTSIDDLTGNDKESSHIILLADMTSPLVAELNKVWKRLGLFAHFEDGRLILLDAKGKTTGEYSVDAGIIQATQSSWNTDGVGACENVVWIVSGTDEAGVRDAVAVLLNDSEELRSAFALAVTSGQPVRIPTPGQ